MTIPPDYHTPARQAVREYLKTKPAGLPGAYFLYFYRTSDSKLSQRKFLVTCFQELAYQEEQERKACLASAGGCKFPKECGQSTDCNGRLISCKQTREGKD